MDQGSLAHAVGRHAGRRLERRPRGHVDDGGGTALPHVRRYRLAQPQRGTQVHIDHVPERIRCRGERVERTLATCAG